MVTVTVMVRVTVRVRVMVRVMVRGLNNMAVWRVSVSVGNKKLYPEYLMLPTDKG